MTVKTVYFVGSDGSEWNNKTYWNKQSLSGTAQILDGVAQGTLYFDVSLNLGDCCLYGDIQSVSITVNGNTYLLYDGGAYCALGAGQAVRSWQIPASDLTAGQAELSVDVCIGGQLPLTAYGVTITAYISESLSVIANQATLTATALANGQAISGVDVVVEDTNTGQSYAIQTDQSGVAYFANLPAGDTVSVTASYSTFQTFTQSLTLQSGNNNVAINLQCPSGFQICNGGCVNACGYGSVLNTQNCQCEYTVFTSLDTLLQSLAIAGLIILGGVAVVKIVPSRKYNIKENENFTSTNSQEQTAQTQKQSWSDWASSQYNKVKGKITGGGNQ